MASFLFILKTLFLTFLVVFALQVSWKEKSLEEHIWVWLHESPVTGVFRKLTSKSMKRFENMKKTGEEKLKKIPGQLKETIEELQESDDKSSKDQKPLDEK